MSSNYFDFVIRACNIKRGSANQKRQCQLNSGVSQIDREFLDHLVSNDLSPTPTSITHAWLTISKSKIKKISVRP